jgi:mannose-6-phosphate isomerase-like protein (cupin superfamily)
VQWPLDGAPAVSEKPAMASREYFTREGCYITELHNRSDDPEVSIARARVEPGVCTALHVVDFAERYLIENGRGVMTLGDAPPYAVAAGDVVVIPAGTAQRIENTGPDDLIFLCVCTPRFVTEGYRELAPRSPL